MKARSRSRSSILRASLAGTSALVVAGCLSFGPLTASVRLEPARDLYAGEGSTYPLEVAVADFDSDGKPDVVAAGYGTDDVAFLKGDGKAGLTYVRSIPVGRGPTAVVAANLDGDGQLDLVVALGRERSLVILLGKGDGTFALARYGTQGDLAASLAVGDLDLDGVLDLVIGFQYGPSGNVFLGNGDGTFRFAGIIGDELATSSLQIARIDGDPWPDIVASSGSSLVFFGLGGGSFEAYRAYTPVSTGLAYQAVGDLNKDGFADLVSISGYCCRGIGIRFGNGDRTFRPLVTIPSETHPRFVLLVDLDGDGNLDLRTITAVHHGRGDGTFETHTPSPYVGDFQVAADLDGDGRPEVVGAEYAGDAVGILHGSLGWNVSTQIGDGPQTAVGVDLDGDGAKEIVVWEAGRGRLRLLRRGLAGRFEPVGQAYPASPIGASPRLLVVDVNQDGFDDVLTGGSWQAPQLFLSDGHGALLPGTLVSDLPSWTFGLGVLDVDGDGRPDVVAGAGGVRWARGRGDGSFENSRFLAEGSFAGVVVADADGDGRPDLISVSRESVSWRLATPLGGLSSPIVFPIWYGGDTFERLLASDLDGDGLVDLITIPPRGEGGSPKLIRGTAPGMPTGAYSLPPRNVIAAALFDADGDGQLDLVTSNRNLLMAGWLRAISLASGGLRDLGCGALPTGGLEPSDLTVLDGDGDGVDDLLICNRVSNRISFMKASPSGVIVPGDVDGDGDVDIFDNLMIQALLVGNIEAGVPPFVRPATAADMDASGAVDLYDLLRHADTIVNGPWCYVL